jgi:hypothetical protein
MRFHGSILPIIMLLFLSACAAQGYSQADSRTIQALSTKHKCDEADKMVDVVRDDPGGRAYNHAYIASNCRSDEDTAIRYLNLSARYGNEQARSVLVQEHQPVPSADLRSAIQSAPAQNNDAPTALLFLGLLNGVNHGLGYDQPPPPLVSTHCTTTGGITNCLSY